MSEYRAKFKSTSKNIAKARDDVRKYAAEWFSGQLLADIESAVGEALANSAEHGAGTAGEIDIRCHVDRRDLVIEVKDTGLGFDRWSEMESVRPMASAERGYGIFIMRELMDNISYSENGTRVRLTKRLPAQIGS
jgi:anti-sigma regulatory factor (Ser/Thr protein kinase)